MCPSPFVYHQRPLAPSEILVGGKVCSCSRPISAGKSGWAQASPGRGISQNQSKSQHPTHSQSILSPTSALAERVDAMAANCLGHKKLWALGEPWGLLNQRDQGNLMWETQKRNQELDMVLVSPKTVELGPVLSCGLPHWKKKCAHMCNTHAH